MSQVNDSIAVLTQAIRDTANYDTPAIDVSRFYDYGFVINHSLDQSVTARLYWCDTKTGTFVPVEAASAAITNAQAAVTHIRSTTPKPASGFVKLRVNAGVAPVSGTLTVFQQTVKV